MMLRTRIWLSSAALGALVFAPFAAAQSDVAATDATFETRPPTESELIAGLREYPPATTRALLRLSNQPDLLKQVSDNPKLLENPDQISPTPSADARQDLRILSRTPDIVAVAAAQPDSLKTLASAYARDPAGTEQRAARYRGAYRAAKLDGLIAWQRALESDPVALGQYRDLLTKFAETQKAEYSDFPVAYVKDRKYYLACPPSELLFAYLEQNPPPEALDRILLRWFTEYSASAIDTRALQETQVSSLPTPPKDLLAALPPAERATLWSRTADGGATVGQVPVILQPEGDQPVEALLATALLEHDRLWSPIWLPSEPADVAPAAPADAYADASEPEYVDAEPYGLAPYPDDAPPTPATVTDDGRVVYDMQPIGSGYAPPPVTDLDRVADARGEFADVVVREGVYGDYYSDDVAYVDSYPQTVVQPIVQTTPAIVYDYYTPAFWPAYSTYGYIGAYPYPYFSPIAWGACNPLWGGWGGWGNPWYRRGFNFNFSFAYGDPFGVNFFNRRYFAGGYYGNYWSPRRGLGRYANGFIDGARFGRFLGGGRYAYGGSRNPGVYYRGRGFRARTPDLAFGRGSSRIGGTDRFRRGFTNGSIRDSRGVRYLGRDVRGGGVRQLDRGTRDLRGGGDGNRSGIRDLQRGTRDRDRGRVQPMQPLDRGIRRGNDATRDRTPGRSTPRDSGALQGIRRGNDAQPRTRSSGSSLGQPRSGIRERGVQRGDSNPGRVQPMQPLNRGIRRSEGATPRVRSGPDNASPRSGFRDRSGVSAAPRVRAQPQRSSSPRINTGRSGLRDAQPRFDAGRSGIRSAPRVSPGRSNIRSAPQRSFDRSGVRSAPRAPSRSSGIRSAPRGFDRSGSSFGRSGGSSLRGTRNFGGGSSFRGSGVRSGGRSSSFRGGGGRSSFGGRSGGIRGGGRGSRPR